ncbi:thioredoxin family protein [Paenarthrobacter nicotinovorans]|uniref:thioredoxin family protein n=1 Tax=Paenarthrobacter nicotinovorans TaxID=29320 RepID=UPI0021B1A19D|nr:thioredoxin family protein [Paenarthrobacter nicotinovorans]
MSTDHPDRKAPDPTTAHDGRYAPVNIDVFHIDDCPNTMITLKHVEDALSALGRSDIPVQLRLIVSPADTAGTCFAGSPTIAANGTDIFPDGRPASELSCRVYQTPDGLSGAPTTNQIIEMLRHHDI